MSDPTTRLQQLRALHARIESEIATEERRITGRRRRRVQRLVHGTDSGYYWHRNHGVPFPEDTGAAPCGCRLAHAQAERERARRAERRAS